MSTYAEIKAEWAKLFASEDVTKAEYADLANKIIAGATEFSHQERMYLDTLLGIIIPILFQDEDPPMNEAVPA